MYHSLNSYRPSVNHAFVFVVSTSFIVWVLCADDSLFSTWVCFVFPSATTTTTTTTMIRTILRSVQNSLVLASVLLVVLALQRLQSYDVTHAYFNDHQQHHHHHHHRESKRHAASTAAESNGHYDEQDDDDDDDDSTRPYPAIVDSAFWRLNQYHPYPDHPNQQRHHHHPKDASAHHQVVLGREYNIGLFRFFLPRLEKRSEGVTRAVVPSSSTRTTTVTATATTTTTTNPGKTSQWQVQPVRTTVALVVDLVNLFPQPNDNNSTTEATTTTSVTTITPSECKSMLDAATVLKWSLLLLQRQIHEEEDEHHYHQHNHLRTKSSTSGHSKFHDDSDNNDNRPRTKPKPSTTLHALLPYKNHTLSANDKYYDLNTARCYDNVTRVLARLGYRVISSREQLQPNPNQEEEEEDNHKQCEGKEEDSTPEWRQYAKTLTNTDVVVRLPLTSILVVPPPQPRTKKNRRNRRRQRRRSLSSSSSSSLHSEEEYTSSSFLSRDPSVSVLVWKDPNTRCNATVHHCHESQQQQQLCGISKRLSIVSFASSIKKEASSLSLSCPLPNPCTNVDKKESPSCHSWQQQWLQMYRQAKSVKNDKIHCSN